MLWFLWCCAVHPRRVALRAKSSDVEATTAALERLRELHSIGPAAEGELQALELAHPLAALQAAIAARRETATSDHERWRWEQMGEADAAVLAAAATLREGLPEAREGPDWWKGVAGAIAELAYWVLRGSNAAERVLLDELNSDDWVAREVDAALRKAWKTPTDVAVSRRLDSARTRLVAGDAKTALALYTQVTEMVPEWAEGWRAKAQVLHRALGKPEEALEAYDQALIRNPRNYVVLLEKGSLLKKLDDYRAPGALRRAAILNPRLKSDVDTLLHA